MKCQRIISCSFLGNTQGLAFSIIFYNGGNDVFTISLCLIVKNEEEVLERCLEWASQISDEIIIVDTGSEDKTKEIAYKFTEFVYDFKWVDDFSAARNFSFSKATKDYQMWLDADDVLTDLDVSKILKLKKELDTNVDVVTMKYNTNFDENGIPILTSTRGRLFKTVNNFLWNDPIHEYVTMSGNIYNSDIFINHKKEKSYSDRNLKIYEKQVSSKKDLSPRSLYYFARELKDNKKYKEAIEYFNKFLDTKLGWVEDEIGACFNLGICYKLVGEPEKSLNILLNSFKMDTPRAEICCELGYYYKEKNDYKKAIFWFKLATTISPYDTLGFVLIDYFKYIPFIELAVCYYQLNDLENAIYFNNLAKSEKPNNLGVKHNEDFFRSCQKKLK